LELTGIAEVSRDPHGLGVIATALYLDKAVLSFAALALLAIAAIALGIPGGQWSIAIILVARTFLYSYCRLNAGLLKALDRTAYIIRIQTTHFFILTACVLTIYSRKSSLVALLFCLLAGQFVEFIFASGVLRRLGLRFRSVPFSLCWSLLCRSTSVGMTYTFSTLMLRGDVVVLSLIASTTVVGAFAAADTGLAMIYVVAWLFSGILLSDLGRLSQNRLAFDAHVRECLRGVIAFGIPAAVIASFLARFGILLVFGRSFAAAALPGAVMMAALPFIFLNAAFLSRAIARNAGHCALAIYGAGALLSLLLNYVLGRWQGATGVAASIVIREAAITLAFVCFWNLPERSPQATVAFKSSPEFAGMLNS